MGRSGRATAGITSARHHARRGIVAAAALLLLQAAPSNAWVRQIAGEIGISDPARAIARDPAGDLMAASAAETAKYDGRTGGILWRVPHAPELQPPRYEIVADARGDALILEDRCCRHDQVEFWNLAKRSGADGRLRWRFTGPAGLRSQVTPLVDARGDVLVVGQIGRDLAAIKIDGATGVQRWLVTRPGIGPHVARGAAVVGRGDVAVTGYFDTPPRSQAVVTKLAGTDGARLWRVVLEVGAGFNEVAFDAAGDVLGAGSVTSGAAGDSSVLAMKLDGATGAVRWRDSSVRGGGASIALDGRGGLIVAGGIESAATGSDVLVARWTADGTPDWQQVVGSSGGRTFDFASDVAVVGDTVVVGGRFDDTSNSDFAVLARSLDDGASRWQLVIDTDDHVFGTSAAWMVVPSGDAHVFVSGGIASAGSHDDALLLKLAAGDGREAWRVTINQTTGHADEEAASIALDPHGDLIAGGTLGSPDTGVRVGAVKLAASNGSEIWRTTVDGLLADLGEGKVLVDPAGDVLATGVVTIGPPTPGSGPFSPGSPAPVALAIVKLAGDDGSESWRYVHADGVGADRVLATDLDSTGDVLIGAFFGVLADARVMKLDGASGAPVWSVPVGVRRFPPDPAPLLVDGADDVVAVVAGFPGVRLVKLSGTDGAELWSVELPAWVSVDALAFDRHDDVLIAGNERAQASHRLVAKLVGATGALVWTADLGPGKSRVLAVDASGDVLVGGSAHLPAVRMLSVAKLDGASGSGAWEHLAPGAGFGLARALVTDRAGDVFVAGLLDIAGYPNFSVLKLDGARGEPRWVRNLRGGEQEQAISARDVTLDGRGNVVAAGSLVGARDMDFAVVSLDAVTGRLETGCPPGRDCSGGRTLRAIPSTRNGRVPRS